MPRQHSLDFAARSESSRRSLKWQNFRRAAAHVAEALEARQLLAATPVFFQPQQTFAAGSGPSAVAVADLNGDGKADLAVSNYLSGTVSVLLGSGNGTFAPQSVLTADTGPAAVVAADINGDGRPDLAVVNEGRDNVNTFTNAGGGNFAAATTFSVGSQPTSISAADFDRDGRRDLQVRKWRCSSATATAHSPLRRSPMPPAWDCSPSPWPT